jgi:hypothetical protein
MTARRVLAGFFCGFLCLIVLWVAAVEAFAALFALDMRGSFPSESGTLVIFSHQNHYVDVLLVDTYVRRRAYDKPTHLLVGYPHSIVHWLFTAYKSNATQTIVAVTGTGTTQKIIDKLMMGETVIAFLEPGNRGRGLAWALKVTDVPCYVGRLTSGVLKPSVVEPLLYRKDMSAEELMGQIKWALYDIQSTRPQVE